MAAKDKQKGNRLFPDITKVITVDSYVLNYGSFLPGKLLGSTLNVGNNSSFEQIVELSIDAASFHYNKKALSEKFDTTELPFPFEVNSSPTSLETKKQSSTTTT